MKTRDRYLSSILLVLIGVIIGTLFAFYQIQTNIDDQADVEVTEVKHSSQPMFDDEELAKLDARFMFKQVAERVKPTVVYIETVVPLSREDMPDDRYHERDGLWDRMLPKRARTVGSGILISSDGYILTNNHVVSQSAENDIEVILNDKRHYNARIVGQDRSTDLAVLKIDGRGFPAITIGNSEEVDVGEWVLAVGNPFQLRSTVTAGIVSALSRDMEIINDQMRVESFIQTDAAINRGNSGGALVNTSGELIGVNTAIASQSGNYQGYGFAVPSNLAAKVAEDIIEYGEVRRALLGVTIASVNSRIARELDMDEIRGVQITSVSPEGAADRSNLRPNDVILSVNGDEVDEANKLQQKIAVLHPGEVVDLRILRDGEVMSKSVELDKLNRDEQQLAFEDNSSQGYFEQEENSGDDRPEMQRKGTASFDLGFRVIALSQSANSDTFDIIITEIIEDSEASEKGLQEGSKILAINDEKVEGLESLNDLIAKYSESKNTLLIEVENKNGQIQTFELER